MKKKVIVTALAIILCIASLIVENFDTAVVSVGRGNEVDRKIESIMDVKNVLLWLSGEKGDSTDVAKDTTIDFVIDYTQPTSLKISRISSLNQNETKKITTGYNWYNGEEYVNVTIKNNVNNSEKIVVKNIDNTVVEFDINAVSRYVEDVEEFEKLFIIEEGEN